MFHVMAILATGKEELFNRRVSSVGDLKAPRAVRQENKVMSSVITLLSRTSNNLAVRE
jgi:phage FluMu protein gp41